MATPSLDLFTERQRVAWPNALTEAARYVGDDIRDGASPDYYWTTTFEDETRPGRGRSVNATWCDGEHFVQIMMDVYGFYSLGVSQMTLVHSNAHDECDCEHCEAERAQEGA